MEMAFIRQEDIMNVVEGLLVEVLTFALLALLSSESL